MFWNYDVNVNTFTHVCTRISNGLSHSLFRSMSNLLDIVHSMGKLTPMNEKVRIWPVKSLDAVKYTYSLHNLFRTMSKKYFYPCLFFYLYWQIIIKNNINYLTEKFFSKKEINDKIK